MNDSKEYLPIKVILPTSHDFKRPNIGGSTKDFTRFYDESRKTLLADLKHVKMYFEKIFTSSNLPSVARVTLREEAFAKSHKPESIFKDKTCPVFGTENFGELLITIMPNSLQNLIQTISTNDAFSVKNDVSKVLSIKPYTKEDALGKWTTNNLQRYLIENNLSSFKLRVFNHCDKNLDEKLHTAFLALFQKEKLQKPKMLFYSDKLNIFCINVSKSENMIDQLSSF
ncbi:MAG TPA: hypothetical protein ENH65_12000, partial [Candidatus Aminicenantes bacterium]|nr:hypothetical protein [Candidatus Aminicenantes bacterium]